MTAALFIAAILALVLYAESRDGWPFTVTGDIHS